MGIFNSCIRHANDGGSMESRHGEPAAAAFGGECGSSSSGGPERCDEGKETLEHTTGSANVGSDIEERIESSKAHWSQLAEQELDIDDEKVVQENRQGFEELQSHPTFNDFFKTFDIKWRQGYGEMLVGEKFAEGAQAELFHAKVIWRDLKVMEERIEWVLKVFKKGTHLHELQAQWPIGYLQWWTQIMELHKANQSPETQFKCDVFCGTLLEDGRFAFLMAKEHGDLRSQIDCAMLGIRDDQGPFSKDEVERIMFVVAQGMDWLHDYNIVHRDLKASNVLVYQRVGFTPNYFVIDFECSIGVVGTGFFRALELLQAIKDGVVGKDPKVFSKEGDVYSYGMTCYEVLTGELPFQSHPLNDYDLVLNGKRPHIPNYAESWMRKLLIRCWDVDCSNRPLFPEILEILSSYSAIVREVHLERQKYEEVSNRKFEERLSQQHKIVKLQ